MGTEYLFDQLVGLLGRRTDDPVVLAFHRVHGLGPPPAVMLADTVYDVVDAERGYTLDYCAELRLPGCYPPRRERGRYIGYLKLVVLGRGFVGTLPDGITTALPRAVAKRRALEHRRVRWYRAFVLRRDERSLLEACYDADDHSLSHFRLSVAELPAGHPEIVGAARWTRAEHVPRAVPDWCGAPPDGPLPPALSALRALQDGPAGGRLGELDVEMYGRFAAGAAAAWTGRPEAERELRVFGRDGTGGLVAFWLVRDGAPIESQPVVFVGSEGEAGPVAADLCDFLHLLAGGIGPMEAVEYGQTQGGEPVPAIAGIAERYLGGRSGRTAEAVLTRAGEEYGDFADRLATLRGQRRLGARPLPIVR